MSPITTIPTPGLVQPIHAWRSESMRMHRRSWRRREPRSASLARLASLAWRTPMAGLPMP